MEERHAKSGAATAVKRATEAAEPHLKAIETVCTGLRGVSVLRSLVVLSTGIPGS